MRGVRLLIVLTAALAASGCARRAATTQYVTTDPVTGQQVVVQQQAPAFAPPPSAPRTSERGFFNGSASPMQAQAYYPPQVIQVPAGRSPPVYVQAPPQPQRPMGRRIGGAYPPPQQPQQSYASANSSYEQPYTLDAGDKLRVVVFGQDGVSGSYMVGAGGAVTIPLVGSIAARGLTTAQLQQAIANKLRQGFVRDPNVSVEVETYRPFFILGEVTNPGQYPYSPNMTAETAVAIAGGFGPRASKSGVKVTRNTPGQQFNGDVPLNFPLRPGDTVQVKERWF